MTDRTKEQQAQNFRSLSRKYSDTSILMHEAIAREIGLSGTDHKYLGFIIQNGEMTAGELSRLTGLTTGAVTGLVDRLEKKKLVKRKFDSEDRRKVIIVPNTKNTLKLLNPFFDKLNEKTSKLVNSFSDQEITVLEKYFTSAIDIMNEMIEQLRKQ
ncbi:MULTISPECIES: MarR family winged helix-turn-helix transcriptional regulator [Olivibacter]|jgi:DNA-binding MarR family transcriptional regulator|uniref:Regulatory protein MarR n=4 Tax=Sphingobacteriaceae TaxID=84566 RepID=F4CCH3_SPHS2|nr:MULTISPECIES: MarR family transcriptional regulator [Olivibacter]MDX3914985.1 MarR family transcriptional regulator [Pseudosphingobacterium sp.]QEL03593.1 MarR family transcriptional regulator [Olivibacter sp. LS-1]